nr:hypothetical protein CFP56_23851 [Quercus suber]
MWLWEAQNARLRLFMSVHFSIVSDLEQQNMANAKESGGANGESDLASSKRLASNTQRYKFWNECIDTKRGDLLLLACCFVTGLLDCSTFRNWAAFETRSFSALALPACQPDRFVVAIKGHEADGCRLTRSTVALGMGSHTDLPHQLLRRRVCLHTDLHHAGGDSPNHLGW